jgi:hypothetical protein
MRGSSSATFPMRLRHSVEGTPEDSDHRPAADHAEQVGCACDCGYRRGYRSIQELDAHRFRILVGEHTDRADQEDEDQQIEDSQHLHSPVLVRAVARTTL